MSNQISAVKSELSRVREAKRNAEGMIELLRSDMEGGKIHLRVSSDEDFRREVAEAIVKEAHPSYIVTCYGDHYTDPVDGRIYRKESQSAWNPWSDSISWRVVPVESLVNQGNNDFSDEVDWAIADIPYRGMVTAYLDAEGEEFEENGDIPEWVSCSEVVAFARNCEEWAELLEGIESDAHEAAVSFAISEFLDEIVVEPFES